MLLFIVWSLSPLVMAANPPLVASQNTLFPAPYQNEIIALGRDGVELKLEGVLTHSGRWSATGTLFLTNVRLVFISPKPDISGLQAFELPLSYIRQEKFNQPILGCNNLTGDCRLVEATHAASSVKFALYFKQGGVGTCIPLFMRFLQHVRVAQQPNFQHAEQQQAGEQHGQVSAQGSSGAAQQFMNTALVDPNDPSKIYLTQPIDDNQRRKDEPKFGGPLI